jgi:SAM-dependent methyltransferase
LSQLERLRSRELILRHAPEPPAVVLDVGGAAGAYAFWLAELGYEVRLIDAVPRLIEIARDRNERAIRRLASCRVADARALPEADGSAAMVLLLGPLYHLVQAEERHAALAESARVLCPGGVLVAAESRGGRPRSMVSRVSYCRTKCSLASWSATCLTGTMRTQPIDSTILRPHTFTARRTCDGRLLALGLRWTASTESKDQAGFSLISSNAGTIRRGARSCSKWLGRSSPNQRFWDVARIY